MKKSIFSLFLLICLLSFLGVHSYADCGISFYIQKNGHSRPNLPKEESVIEKYDCYYLDKNVTDESSDKVIYLTFDLGYVNENAESIIKTLREENVNACFFILDHVVYSHTELLKQMKKDGHIIGNHSKNHKDMTKLSNEEMTNDLMSLENIYKEKTGNDLDKYFRFPEGKFNESALRTAQSLGYKTLFWSFAYVDWDNHRQPNPEKSIDKILSNTHNGEVILLHPTSKTNAEILPTLIEQWKKMGYRFGSVNELTV